MAFDIDSFFFQLRDAEPPAFPIRRTTTSNSLVAYFTPAPPPPSHSKQDQDLKIHHVRFHIPATME